MSGLQLPCRSRGACRETGTGSWRRWTARSPAASRCGQSGRGGCDSGLAASHSASQLTGSPRADRRGATEGPGRVPSPVLAAEPRPGADLSEGRRSADAGARPRVPFARENDPVLDDRDRRARPSHGVQAGSVLCDVSGRSGAAARGRGDPPRPADVSVGGAAGSARAYRSILNRSPWAKTDVSPDVTVRTRGPVRRGRRDGMGPSPARRPDAARRTSSAADGPGRQYGAGVHFK